MLYDIDVFVNTNSFNVQLPVDNVSDEDMFETLPAQFVTDNSVVYDTVNQDADPVFVYELNGAPVAWYDCENFVGFVVK